MIIAEYKETLLSKRMIPAVKNTWEEPLLPKVPKEASWERLP